MKTVKHEFRKFSCLPAFLIILLRDLATLREIQSLSANAA
jgi:hypothetical protein